MESHCGLNSALHFGSETSIRDSVTNGEGTIDNTGNSSISGRPHFTLVADQLAKAVLTLLPSHQVKRTRPKVVASLFHSKALKAVVLLVCAEAGAGIIFLRFS